MQIFGHTITAIPAIGAESGELQVRMDKYGAMDVMPRMDAQEADALEGSLYVARPAPVVTTPTTYSLGVQVAFSDTANIAVCLQNGNAAGGKSLIPQYLKARLVVAPASATAMESAIEVDSTNRYTSGGTLVTGLPTNPSGAATAAVCHFGGVTAAAAGAGRAWVYAGQNRSTIPVVGDTFFWSFGALGTGAEADSSFFPATTISHITIPVISVAIPPTGTMLLHIANVGNVTTAPTYEWEIGWIER